MAIEGQIDADTHTSDAPAIAPLVLRTLGTLALTRADRSDVLLGAGKSLALLAYVALTPGRRVSREVLLDLLWADQEPERARNALRQALWGLRRLLGDAVLRGTEELTLGEGVVTDRDRFLAAVERQDYDLALANYTGDFVPGFALPGGARFEQWADLERRRLQGAFVRTAELQVRRWLKQARFRDAQLLARRARDAAPHMESAWRLLLETIVASRDFVAAAVEADALEAWAAAEEIPLDEPTRAVLRAARQVKPAESDSHDGRDDSLVAELTGREQQFAQVVAMWEQARTGPSQAVHLLAPAGLGKTRLLREITARLRAGGAPVIMLRGAPADRHIPFAFAGDLAMAVASRPGAAGVAPASASALIALNPALSSRLTGDADSATGEEAMRRRLLALTDLVQAVADEHPLVLAIDDLHWIDQPSVRILEGLLSRLGDAPVLCITTGRPERRLAPDVSRAIDLAPLSCAQVQALLGSIGRLPEYDAWSTTLGEGLHRATRGSPLLTLETLRLAMDEDVLALEGGAWCCRDERRLAALLRSGEAIRARVQALAPTEGWLLALLAVAGSPISTDALMHAGAGRTIDVPASLAVLERLGMVLATGDGWSPSHDEIAESAEALLDLDTRREISRTLGALLVETSGGDAAQLRRGVRLLSEAGADGPVRQAFRSFVGHARTRGDRRSHRVLATELLGDDRSPAEQERLVGTLVRALPLSWRAGLWSNSRRTVALVFAAALGLAGATIARDRLRDQRAAVRLVYADSASGTGAVTSAVTVTAGEWDGRSSTVPRVPFAAFLADAAHDFPDYPPAQSPDGRSVAWNRTSGDSTTIDIWLRTPGGARRLTQARRDDVVTGWLPDGSALIGVTNRWSPPDQGSYDVAVYDTATGTARQLTRGIDHDGQPTVSPDGTRVAFVRESANQPTRLCVVALDGVDEPVCRAPMGEAVSQLVGWLNAEELLIALDRANARPLVRFDWSRGAGSTLTDGYVHSARLSPDRHWAVARALVPGMSGTRDWIIPLDAPAKARAVVGSEGSMTPLRWWEGVSDLEAVVAHVEFTDTAHTILPGISTRLAVRAVSAAGTQMALHVPVRWHSSDSTIAVVNDSGDVRARGSGTVTIDASVAGRVARRVLTVRAAPARLVFSEGWTDDWTTRWWRFGDPAPAVVMGPRGVRGFWNHGDLVYRSFALSRVAFDARQGLGVELTLSVPFDSLTSQRVRTELVALPDTAAIAHSDPRSPTPFTGQVLCGATYPGGTGNFGGDRLVVSSGVTTWIPLDGAGRTVRTGVWWTLRLQIFPDGRCGVAVDGRVRWISPEPVAITRPVYLRLGDVSAGVPILHGPLTVWQGVRTDIDWR